MTRHPFRAPTLASVLAALLTLPALPATAQQQKSLSASIEVYVFPTKGQEASQQSKEEVECYEWATKQTGTDPFELQKQAASAEQQARQSQQQAQQSGAGAGARGAVKGAAVGALIGEIANDDPGKGAAWGAGAGLLAGASARARRQQQAAAQADSQAQQARSGITQQQQNFKKAFAACLEAKSYMVKF